METLPRLETSKNNGLPNFNTSHYHHKTANSEPNGRNGDNWTRLPFLRDDDKTVATSKENSWNTEIRLKLPKDGSSPKEHTNVNELYDSFARKPREQADANDEGRKRRRRKHRHRRHRRAQESQAGEDEDPTDESSDQQRRHRHRRRKHRTGQEADDARLRPGDTVGDEASGDLSMSSTQGKSTVATSRTKAVKFPIETNAQREQGKAKDMLDHSNATVETPKVEVAQVKDQATRMTTYKPQLFKVATSKGVEGQAIRLESARKQNGIRSVLLTQKAVERQKVVAHKEPQHERGNNMRNAKARGLSNNKLVERPRTEADVSRKGEDEKPKGLVRSTTCIARRVAVQPTQHKLVVSNDREVARYQQMLSVYLDEKWHKARKQRFFKMLEQFQMKNNVEHAVKQRAKAREIHKSMLRQNEQLEYVRTKHLAEKEKRLASQHVKWKFVRNAINDRQRFGLPTKLHDVVIAKQNMEKNLISDRRKRTFSKSELRRRNEARFEFMFEASTGKRYITAVPNV